MRLVHCLDRAAGILEGTAAAQSCHGQCILASFHKPVGSEAAKRLSCNDRRPRVEVFRKELILGHGGRPASERSPFATPAGYTREPGQ